MIRGWPPQSLFPMNHPPLANDMMVSTKISLDRLRQHSFYHTPNVKMYPFYTHT